MARDGESAVKLARSTAPELVLLDISLPVMDGIEVCRQLRQFSDAYVIMLTSRDEEFDRVLGLAVGADDYVTKPFSAREAVNADQGHATPATPTGGECSNCGTTAA